jgi:phage terminase large subunit-like protein
VTPAYENTFKRLHLNIWTQQETRWLQMTEWDACALPAVNYDTLRGRRCFGGLDLASTTDIAALALIFPGDPFIVLPFFWIPEDRMHDRVLRDRVPYDVWQREGYIEATPGNVIDYRYIMLCLGRCRADFDFKSLAFDRFGATEIMTTLCDDYGFTSDEKEAANFHKPMLYAFGQGWASMSSPTKELLNYILARKITHGGNPVLRWMANNVVVKTDSAGNLKPDKGRSIEKIDGIVATIMGLELALRQGNEKTSKYQTEGLFVL